MVYPFCYETEKLLLYADYESKKDAVDRTQKKRSVNQTGQD